MNLGGGGGGRFLYREEAILFFHLSSFLMSVIAGAPAAILGQEVSLGRNLWQNNKLEGSCSSETIITFPVLF